MAKKELAVKKEHKDSFVKRNKIELILFITAFCVFANSIGNKYAMDDELVTEKNQQVALGVKGIGKIFGTYYTEGTDMKYSFEYRPVVKATFAIEYQLFGFNPAISHLINVLLYAISICLLYRLLVFLFKDWHYLFSFLVCLVFAVHPLHTEAVASLKNRDELLSFLFSVLATQHVIRFLLQKKWLYLLWALVFFVLGVFSKQNTFLFMFIIPLMCFYFFRKEVKWLLYAPFFLLGFGIQSLIKSNALSDDQAYRQYNFYENPLYQNPQLSNKIALAAGSFGFYVKMFFVPYPLCYYYGYNEFSVPSFTSVAFILPLLIGLFFLFVIWKFFKSNKLLSFGLAFFVLSVSAYLNVLTPVVGVVAERFEFVPSLGLCIAFIATLGMVFKVDFRKERNLRFTELAPAIRYSVLSICVVFSVYSVIRNRQWKDRMTLYTHDIVHLQNSAKAHELYAGTLVNEASQSKNQAERSAYVLKAIEHYEKAIQIYPAYLSAYNNLGSIYFNFYGDYKTPIQYFEKIIKLDTNYVAAYQNLGSCYARNGNIDKGIQLMAIALRKDKGKNPNVLLTMAGLYQDKKEYAKADEFLAQAKSKFPLSDLPYIQHSNFLLSRSDTLGSLQQLELAVDKKTQNEQVYQYLIGYYGKRGKNEDVARLSTLLEAIQRNRE